MLYILFPPATRWKANFKENFCEQNVLSSGKYFYVLQIVHERTC